MIKKHILNQLCIFEYMIDNSKEVNEQLLKEIKDHRKESPDPIPGSNTHCWRGSKKYPSENLLLDLFGKAVLNTVKDQGLDINKNDYHLRFLYWVNVNGFGGHNDIHNHMLSDYSGVYYVQGIDTGRITFTSEPHINKMIMVGMPFYKPVTIHPKDGMLLVFPSYMLHSIDPNLSKKERINIAFDVNIDKKK